MEKLKKILIHGGSYIFCVFLLDVNSAQRIQERLDRGLIAIARERGGIYLSWRLFTTDPPSITFHLYRVDKNGRKERISKEPIKNTNFIDLDSKEPENYKWFLTDMVDGRERASSVMVSAISLKDHPPYIKIPLQGKYTFQKIGFGDLNGDRQIDFVIKQPDENVDPADSYWKPSQATYKIEAYSFTGKFLWRKDLGWSIEQGIWYSPYVVYDLDGDGIAEVVVKTGEGDPRGPTGKVETGAEYLTILDGQTGQEIEKVAWPPREPFYKTGGKYGYNYASRNQLGIAYLDGRNPHLIVVRGTYGLIMVRAYQFAEKKLQLIWEWSNESLDRKWWGQGAHWLHATDIDGDGKDEVIIGSVVIDDNGKPLWSTGLGHPDHVYIGDIDPERVGLEIYYGIEPSKERYGMCLVDAATGKIIWGIERPTRHVHGQGMCSDIDPRYIGSECYSADTNEQKQYAWSRLWSSKGVLISEENLNGFSPLACYWDADAQRELIVGRSIRKYYPAGEVSSGITGRIVAVADIIGDWREEIITTVEGEIRIYVTSIPTTLRIPSLIYDPIYRIDMAHASMGYYQVPGLSFDLASYLK